MNYIKKMCILRQVKQGFSGDGKALSGLIKIEQYGKNLAVKCRLSTLHLSYRENITVCYPTGKERRKCSRSVGKAFLIYFPI